MLLNVRGISLLEKQEHVKNLMAKVKPDIVGLTETRLKKPLRIKDVHSI